jgi:hypothetical protein
MPCCIEIDHSRKPVRPTSRVGAVIQVESAQEVLAGLADAAVLRHVKAGHVL